MAHSVLVLRKLLLAAAGLGMTTYIQAFFLLFCMSFTNVCYGERSERSEKREVLWKLKQSLGRF